MSSSSQNRVQESDEVKIISPPAQPQVESRKRARGPNAVVPAAPIKPAAVKPVAPAKPAAAVKLLDKFGSRAGLSSETKQAISSLDNILVALNNFEDAHGIRSGLHWGYSPVGTFVPNTPRWGYSQAGPYVPNAPLDRKINIKVIHSVKIDELTEYGLILSGAVAGMLAIDDVILSTVLTRKEIRLLKSLDSYVSRTLKGMIEIEEIQNA